MTGIVNVTGARSGVIGTITATAAAGFNSSTFLDQGTLFSRASANTLNIPDLGGMVDGTLVEITATTKALGTSGNWDTTSPNDYTNSSTRAGKDFYVYLLKAGGVILSGTSTYPSGSTAANSRKIAGFHCVCAAVGTISGHTLTDYGQGDILPQSVWDRFNRPISTPEGMVLSLDGMWADIYLPSVSTVLVSVNGGTIADGTSSEAFHCLKFEQWFGDIGKQTIRQAEFVTASLGSNQGTNIAGGGATSTTGGHSDTAGRRMISNIGCEDMCGVMRQWCRDTSASDDTGLVANGYDSVDSGVGGQQANLPYRGALGGAYFAATVCGSRASEWSNNPLALGGNDSTRGVSVAAGKRL
jgi:hypothetical protein